MKYRYWIYLFIIFGLYGSFGEILIGTVFQLFGRTLWIYYNGFFTSFESFLLFGLFGCIGFKIYLKIKSVAPTLKGASDS